MVKINRSERQALCRLAIHDFHNGRWCTDLETILHGNEATKALKNVNKAGVKTSVQVLLLCKANNVN